MIMMSLELTGKVPFETVYLHGLVRDEKGRKMSKSLGNIVEPVELSRQWVPMLYVWHLLWVPHRVEM